MNNPQGQPETARQALRRAMRDSLGIPQDAPHPSAQPETPKIPDASQAKERLITGAKQGQVSDWVDERQDELLRTGVKQGQVSDVAAQNRGIDRREVEALVTGAKQGRVSDAAGQNRGNDPRQDEALVTGAKQGPSVAKTANPAPQERTGNGGSVPPKQHRFQPGQSGNPGGRPKNAFNRLLRQLLAADDRKYAKLLAQSLVNHACRGNQSAIHELLARVDPQPHTTTLREKGRK